MSGWWRGRRLRGRAPRVPFPRAVGLLTSMLVLAGFGTGAAQETHATVDDFAWMAGEWVGEGPGGAVAEIDYMPPEGGVLPALFRLTQDGAGDSSPPGRKGGG